MVRVPTEKALARAEVQRSRILDAAYSCFVETGFHAAGMAAIAERADMSPGLIYRYFPGGKGEIIQAIIEDQLRRAEEQIGNTQTGDHIAQFMACIEPRDVDRREINYPLMLELSALASRDPAIAAAVIAFDGRVRRALAAWVTRFVRETHAVDLTPEEAAVRALTYQMVFEGTVVRIVREPGIDRQVARAAIEQLLLAATAAPPVRRTNSAEHVVDPNAGGSR